MSVVRDDVKDTIEYLNTNNVDGCGRIYQTSNEEIEELYSNIDFNNKKVLSVLASGDQPLMAYLNGAKKVDLFDINKLTLHYYFIRLWTLKYLHTFYPEPFLCKEYVSSLLKLVKPESDLEEESINYWKSLIGILKDYEFIMLFFSIGTCIQLDKDRIDKLTSIITKEKPTFHNIDISKEIDLNDKYDVIITSNIVDWLCADGRNIRLYKDNIDRLLNSNGVVLCSNLGNDIPMPCERYLFEENFDYYEIHGISDGSFDYVPGYKYVKR